MTDKNECETTQKSIYIESGPLWGVPYPHDPVGADDFGEVFLHGLDEEVVKVEFVRDVVARKCSKQNFKAISKQKLERDQITLRFQRLKVSRLKTQVRSFFFYFHRLTGTLMRATNNLRRSRYTQM